MLKTLAKLFTYDEHLEEKTSSYVDIEMMDNKYYLLKCFYRNHKSVELIELPEVIYFYHDSIRFGDVILKYEYIANFNICKSDCKMVIINTFTRIVDGKIECVDQIGQFALIFDTNDNINYFISKLYSKLLSYKDINNFDKKILHFKNFKKIYRNKKMSINT
jgi:hypothetical protein